MVGGLLAADALQRAAADEAAARLRRIPRPEPPSVLDRIRAAATPGDVERVLSEHETSGTQGTRRKWRKAAAAKLRVLGAALLCLFALAGQLLAQETERLPVVDVTEADLAPGRVCDAEADCDCYVPAGADTWTLRRCIPTWEIAPGSIAVASDPTEPPAEPPAEDTFKDPDVSVAAGASIILDTFGTGETSSVTPFASVWVDWILAGKQRPVAAFVQADYTGLPDSQVTFTSVNEFDAVMIEVGLSYRPAAAVSASGYCSGGFASRFTRGVVEPHTSAPLWASCGLAFRDRGDHKARLRVGLGADERLGFGWTMAAHVKGAIRLSGIGDSRFGVTLLADAILGLETPVGQKQRVNVITASVAMSWDSE